MCIRKFPTAIHSGIAGTSALRCKGFVGGFQFWQFWHLWQFWQSREVVLAAALLLCGYRVSSLRSEYRKWCYHSPMPVDAEIQTTFVPPLKAPRGNELSCK